MSATAILWIILFVWMVAKGMSRPVWALCAYLMTFFAAPVFWWWGKGTLSSITMSWNLIAASVLAISVFLHWGDRPSLDGIGRKAFLMLALFTLNAGIVQLLFANFPEHSWTFFDLAWKQAGLTLLIYFAVRSVDDLRIFLIALMFGSAYIGVEVVLRDQGSIEKGRLEGIFLPGAGDTNGLSGAISMAIPIAGYFFLSAWSKWYVKLIAVVSAVLVLETLLRCNSRGAYLAMIAAGCWLIYATKGKARKKVLVLCALGAFTVLLQAKNEKIWERFYTTFAGAEERDNSANERIEYWKAAINMISDHPLGSGGEAAFNSPLGNSYITHIRDFGGEFRAVHNGYLDVAAGWGVQGLLLFLLLLVYAFYHTHKVVRHYGRRDDAEAVLLGATIQAILISQAVVAMFISSLDNEWFYWCVTLLLLYRREFSEEKLPNESQIQSTDYELAA